MGENILSTHTKKYVESSQSHNFKKCLDAKTNKTYFRSDPFIRTLQRNLVLNSEQLCVLQFCRKYTGEQGIV